MLKTIFTIFIIFTLSNNLYAQTITSTTTGGKWNATATWLGGVVPTSTNDVVIDGTVEVTSGAACKNLTINTGKTLQNEANWWTLTVDGNLVNNGIIQNHVAGHTLTINVSGNITNNGTWIHNMTRLTGQGDQTLTLGTDKVFGSTFESTDSIGTIIASSALEFNKSFDLKKSIMNMQNNFLTLQGSGNISNGRVINTTDIIGKGNPVIRNITYEGNINIKQRVWIGTNITLRGTVTVVDTLQNDGDWRTLTVDGNLVNNGTIQNHVAGYTLTINVSGNITNNGTWIHNMTRLTGQSNQTLSLGTDKVFGSIFESTDSIGAIIASSALEFNKSFALNKSVLNMQTNGLTLQGSGNISNGRVINTTDIIGKGNPVIKNITYEGNINIKQRVFIGTSVTMVGTVTVVDTLQNEGDWRTLTVDGNVVNNGIIQNHVAGYTLTINVSGNITNNGAWIHNMTRLTGQIDQTLTLGSDKIFGSIFESTDSIGVITASTALEFNKSFDLKKSIMNMQNNALTLQGSGNISNGRVINATDIIGIGNPVIKNITYEGNINIKQRVLIGTSVTMVGTVTVVDTLQNENNWWTLTVDGNLVNNGIIQNHVAGYTLTIDVNGNVTNNGTMALSTINLSGIGSRTIATAGATSTFRSTGAHVILVGENILPNLTVVSGSRCIVDANGSLQVFPGAITGNLENRGKVNLSKRITTTQDYGFFAASARVVTGSGIDTLTVESYGHQVQETFANAVRSWWRFIPTPYTTSASISSLTLSYRDTEIGANTKSTLQVFHSSDSGSSWRQISTTLNTVRDTVNNWVAITDVPIAGDFLLSSNPDPVSVRPSVILSIIGRDQIRVGPPNRYTIHYVNNSDVSTGDMIMEIKSQGLVHIRRIEPSMPVGVAPQIIPIDSLTYGGNKEQALLWVTSMAPREERTFDVVFVAYPDINSITSPNETKAIPLIAAGLWWAAKGLAVAYVTDATLNMTEEIWRPVAPCETVTDALKEAVKESFRKTNEEWFGWEKPAKEISKNAAEELLKLKGINLPSTVLLDATGKTINGMQRYLQDDFKIKDCEGKERPPTGDVTKNTKSLQKTMSWDPNEKVAPSGFGENGFISSAGRMNYRILFENLKAATAPAWRIIIVDTLSDVFDPQSVVFGTTSHEGPQYNWIKTIDGNIVRWEIEDIELPPNVIPPEGEGYVDFSVMTKSGLSSATELRNKAMIVFDYNQPIITNEVVNTLDFLSPVTQMLELPTQVDPPKLTVRWNSIDGANGSGVQSVILYSSENGGVYNPIGTTDADSFVVSVNPGSNYSFYALGKDNVGNVEQVRPVSVATVVTSVSTDDIEALPKQYSLSQNYPNPFNPTTMIQFELPKEAYVTLKVYNVLGQEVATLVDENTKAGNYKIQFDGSKLASSVYFYRLTAGDFVAVKKFILMK